MSFRDKAERLQRIATSKPFFKDEILYRPQNGGVSFKIDAIFFEEFKATDTDSGTEFSGTIPNVDVKLNSLPNAPKRGDLLDFEDKTYEVYDIHPDGLGMVNLFLHIKGPLNG